MDPGSFKSILAGVKRMREEYGVSEPDKRHEVEASGQLASSAIETQPQEHQAPQESQERPQAAPQERRQVAPQERPHERERVLNNRVGRGLPAVQLYSKIQVAPSQKGNPAFKSALLKTKPIEFNKDILSDYYINPTLQILFLSLKYHQLRPEYIWRRCKKMNQGSSVSNTRDHALRVLLVVIDVESPQESLRKLNNICIKQDLTLIVVWSFEQAGDYIALFKENELSKLKLNLIIKGVKQDDYKTNLTTTLTTIKAINKTDVINLMTEVGSFKNIALSDSLDIQGLGERKIERLKNAFTEPFVYK